MKQLLLFPDQRPLVARLGQDFFQTAPEAPGVYLMRNAADEVLYVGKAKNLRKRLSSYRVANPDRMSRRHLRLVSGVTRIELHRCETESSALAKEAALLRNLRPRFNRAGTWPASPRFVVWRLSAETLLLGVTEVLEEDWSFIGPLGSLAMPVRNALLRLLWSRLFLERGLAGMPQGWFHGRCGRVISLRRFSECDGFGGVLEVLSKFSAGEIEPLQTWVKQNAPESLGTFDKLVREADMELLTEIAMRRQQPEAPG